MDELGHTVNQYTDGSGQLRHEAEGLELRQALLPSLQR
jgi:hypothetical protein